MEENEDFLKNLITEDIYVIEKKDGNTSSNNVTQKEHNTEETAQPAHKEEPKVEETPPVTFDGENNKNILVLVEDISAAEEEFMTKILAAVSLSKSDIAIVKTKSYNLTYESVVKELASQKIISFGVNLFEFGLKGAQVAKYEIQEVNEKHILYADNLAKIAQDVNAKKALWANLQRLFL